jgi:hypothetical protein
MPTDTDIRAKIAATALSFVGSKDWADATEKDNFPANTNKCNLFVYDILTAAGASPGLPHGHWFWHRYPPNAIDWADSSFAIPHWRMLRANETPDAGDVIAQNLAYSDATGHVMIVGNNGSVIGTGDRGPGPHGTIEIIARPLNLGPKPRAPEVFRRYDTSQ